VFLITAVVGTTSIPAPKKIFLDQNETGSRFLLAQEAFPARCPRPFLPAIERGRGTEEKPAVFLVTDVDEKKVNSDSAIIIPSAWLGRYRREKLFEAFFVLLRVELEVRDVPTFHPLLGSHSDLCSLSQLLSEEVHMASRDKLVV
jgi:hypothetical protein